MRADLGIIMRSESGVIYRNCQWVKPERRVIAERHVGTIPSRWVGTNSETGKRMSFTPERKDGRAVRLGAKVYYETAAKRIVSRIQETQLDAN